MSANTGFSLSAAAGSLLISVASAVKDRPEVAIVFALLLAGFLYRASEGLRERRRAERERADAAPTSPPPQRRVKRTRFRRR